MIKMIVFDMAGTTVNEDNVVYKTLQHVINTEANYAFSLAQVLEYGAGKEKRTAIKDILALQNNTDELLINKLYNSFIVALANAYDKFELKPQPNAEELFAALKNKNILVVLNTGYNRATANTILQKLNWEVGKQIDALITATDVSNNRPNPNMIFLAMKQFNITDAKQVAKIGDSIIDIEEGQNAGCSLCIGITTGAHTYEQLIIAKPTAIINNLMQILELI